jgi:hypothetical protein
MVNGEWCMVQWGNTGGRGDGHACPTNAVMQVEGVNITYKRLPFPEDYFDLGAAPDVITPKEESLLDVDVLIFQFGQWPAGTLTENKGSGECSEVLLRRWPTTNGCVCIARRALDDADGPHASIGHAPACAGTHHAAQHGRARGGGRGEGGAHAAHPLCVAGHAAGRRAQGRDGLPRPGLGLAHPYAHVAMAPHGSRDGPRDKPADCRRHQGKCVDHCQCQGHHRMYCMDYALPCMPCRRGGWMSGPGRARLSRWSRVSGGCRR